MLPGAPAELTLAGAVRQGRFLQFYYKQEARFWQASGCGGGGCWEAPLSVLALSAACGGTSPARVGGSPLSLAALAGVSPALPRGEPSLRPWTEVNFVVR